MSLDEPFLGIDFGTAYCAMAWVHPETGQAEVIRNGEGEEKTRSAVYFSADGVRVGRLAEEYLEDETEATRVVLSCKRELAKKTICGFVDGRRLTPQDVATEVFNKLKRDAEKSHFHRPVRRAVVTVPASFDELQKGAIQKAAKSAGFEEVELLEEPVAAAIAYFKAGLDVGRRVLVFDVGAGTFDTAVLDREDDDRKPFCLALKPRGIPKGGDDFDMALMAHLQERFCLTPRERRSLSPWLLHRCRRAKECLSQCERHTLSISLPGGRSPRKEVTRATFEALIAEDVDELIRVTAELAREAEEQGRPVETLVLIGGSARIPLIADRIEKALRIEPRSWHGQDVAVALGAAYHGATLWGAKGAKVYRQALRRSARDPVSVKLLRELEQERVRLALPSVQAEVIEAAELGQTLEHRLARAIAAADSEYEEALRAAWRNGVPDDHGLRALAEKAEHLGLTAVEAETVERRALGGTKEEIFRGQQRARREQADSLLRKAEMSHREGRLDQALASVQAVCDAEPTLLAARALLVEILQQLKRWDAVEPAATVWLRLTPMSVEGLLARGRARLEQGRYRDAIADFNAVPMDSLSVTVATTLAWRAAARSHLTDYRGAADDLEKALQDHSKCVAAGMPVAATPAAIGVLYLLHLKQPLQALRWFAAALEKLGSHSDAAVEPFRQFLFHFDPGSSKRFDVLILDDLVLALQMAMWEACQQSFPRAGDAAAKFVATVIPTGIAVHNVLWTENEVIGFEIVKQLAQAGRFAYCRELIHELVTSEKIDVVRLQTEPTIRACSELMEYLTPKWSYTEDHGVLLNQFTIKNESPFSLHDVTIDIETRGAKPQRHRHSVAVLRPREEAQRSDVFVNPGLFGSHITDVAVKLTCRETPVEEDPDTVGEPKSQVIVPAGEASVDGRGTLYHKCPHCGVSQGRSLKRQGQIVFCIRCCEAYRVPVIESGQKSHSTPAPASQTRDSKKPKPKSNDFGCASILWPIGFALFLLTRLSGCFEKPDPSESRRVPTESFGRIACASSITTEVSYEVAVNGLGPRRDPPAISLGRVAGFSAPVELAAGDMLQRYVAAEPHCGVETGQAE